MARRDDARRIDLLATTGASFSAGRFDRRRLLAGGGALGGGLALGALGRRDALGQDGTPAAEAEPTPTPEPAVQVGESIPDAPTLTIWSDTSFTPDFAEASAQFVTDYGVNLVFQPFGFNDIITNFLLAAPNGSGPDIIDTNIDLLGQAFAAGLLAPVDFGAKLPSLDERAINGWTLGGQVHGLPISVESICMYRNPELVPEAIATWDQFRTVAADLLAQGVPYPFIFDGNAYLFIGVITAFGGYCFNYLPDGTYDVNDVGLDNEGAIQAAQLLDEMVKQGWLSAGTSGEIASEFWPQNQAATMLSGPWQIGGFDEVGANYVIDPLPQGPAGPATPWLSARGFAVNAFSQNLILAQSFLVDYWAADAPMASFAQATQKESAWTPVKASTATPVVDALIAAAETAIPIPSDPLLSAYWPAVGDAITQIINQQADPAEVMRNAAAQVRAAVAEA